MGSFVLASGGSLLIVATAYALLNCVLFRVYTKFLICTLCVKLPKFVMLRGCIVGFQDSRYITVVNKNWQHLSTHLAQVIPRARLSNICVSQVSERSRVG